MKRCPNCNAFMYSNEVRCGSCGLGGSGEAKKWSKGQIVMVVVGCLLVLGMFSKKEEKPMEHAKPVDTLALIIQKGKVMGITAVKMDAKDPESVRFLSQTYEQYYPGTGNYVGKWLITATNSFGGRVQAYGIATVHYKGGDINNTDNWEVVSSRIENVE